LAAAFLWPAADGIAPASPFNADNPIHKEAKEMTTKRFFEFGGYAAALVLVAFGIASLVLGVNGRNEVRTDVKREYIVGSPDMNKTAIAAEAKEAKLPAAILADLPTCNVAGKPIDSGSRAKCFASYMRIHTLEATGGYTYAQMGRFQAKPGAPKAELAVGGGTNNPAFAVIDATTNQPVTNGARDLWVTETALTTALNTSFFAEQVSLFSIVIGLALLLVGIGLGILAFVAFRLVPVREAKKQLQQAAAAATKPVTT
jgi:hypothetical protein